MHEFNSIVMLSNYNRACIYRNLEFLFDFEIIII